MRHRDDQHWFIIDVWNTPIGRYTPSIVSAYIDDITANGFQKYYWNGTSSWSIFNYTAEENPDKVLLYCGQVPDYDFDFEYYRKFIDAILIERLCTSVVPDSGYIAPNGEFYRTGMKGHTEFAKLLLMKFHGDETNYYNLDKYKWVSGNDNLYTEKNCPEDELLVLGWICINYGAVRWDGGEAWLIPGDKVCHLTNEQVATIKRWRDEYENDKNYSRYVQELLGMFNRAYRGLMNIYGRVMTIDDYDTKLHQTWHEKL